MIFAHSDAPLKVTLLLFPGLSLLSLAATLDPLRGANRVLGRPAYGWKLVSIDGKMPVASCGLPIPVDGAFNSTEKQDALILIAAFDAIRCGTPSVLRSLRAAAKRSAIVGGVELGVLAHGSSRALGRTSRDDPLGGP